MSRGTATLLALLCALPARAQTPSWLLPDLLAAAKPEGGFTVYSSMNEQEALPLWKLFEDATGIKVAFVRASDTQLTAKVLIEARSGKPSWDILATTNVTRLPAAMRREFSPPEARGIADTARDKARRWYGVTANYNAPAWNTTRVKAAEMPATIEEFIAKKEWRGHVAMDANEFHWLRALVLHYGEEKGRRLAKQFFAALEPFPVDGHLALARAIGSGDVWATPANYANLTINQMISGAPTDYRGMTPVGLFYTQIAIGPQAPHPKSAELAANFWLSREAQQFITRMGRMPVREDVVFNPPDALAKLGDAKVYPLEFDPEEERYWQKEFQALIRPK